MKDERSSSTALVYQSVAKTILSELFNIDDINRGVRLVSVVNYQRNLTSPPDETDQSKALSLCEKIFEGITLFVLGNKPYPFQLVMPEYLGWKQSSLWVFPSIKQFMAPHDLAKRDELRNTNVCIDYENGRLATDEEIKRLNKNSTFLRLLLAQSKKILAAPNSDYRHSKRLELAMLAHNAFVQMFFANVAMNPSQVRMLKWNDKCEISTEYQGFREVKARAGSKLVSFRIESKFVSSFKRFLKLREYILNGRKHEFLFLNLGKNLTNKSIPKKMRLTVTRDFFKTLRRIDPSLKTITPREWRAAKSDWLLRNTDVSTTALVLQNSEATVMKYYAAGSETRAAEEMTNYFEKLSGKILDEGAKSPPGSLDGPVGECKQYGSPKPIVSGLGVQPDCQQPEGCLFCDNYVVHADDRDTRKLLSCRYCINQTASLSESEEHFQALFAGVLKRIDAILEGITAKSMRCAEIVERVTLEVEEEGRLDPYWEKKLEMLINIGAISA